MEFHAAVALLLVKTTAVLIILCPIHYLVVVNTLPQAVTKPTTAPDPRFNKYFLSCYRVRIVIPDHVLTEILFMNRVCTKIASNWRQRYVTQNLPLMVVAGRICIASSNIYDIQRSFCAIGHWKNLPMIVLNPCVSEPINNCRLDRCWLEIFLVE